MSKVESTYWLVSGVLLINLGVTWQFGLGAGIIGVGATFVLVGFAHFNRENRKKIVESNEHPLIKKFWEDK